MYLVLCLVSWKFYTKFQKVVTLFISRRLVCISFDNFPIFKHRTMLGVKALLLVLVLYIQLCHRHLLHWQKPTTAPNVTGGLPQPQLYPDSCNSPPRQFPTICPDEWFSGWYLVHVVVLVENCVLQIVILVGNNWALF